MPKDRPISQSTIRIGQAVATLLDQIAEFFKPGAKLTLIVRIPDHPDRDILITNDDLAEVTEAVERSVAREEIQLD